MENTQEIISEIDNVVGEEGTDQSEMTQSTQGIMGNIDQLLQPAPSSSSDAINITASPMQQTEGICMTHKLSPEQQGASHPDLAQESQTDLSQDDSCGFEVLEEQNIETVPVKEGIPEPGSGNESRISNQSADMTDINRRESDSDALDNLEPAAKRMKSEHAQSDIPSQSDKLITHTNYHVNTHSNATDFMIYSSSRVKAFSSTDHGMYGHQPVLLAEAASEFTEDNYLRGCKWAPDGSCILTVTNDNYLRVFNNPSLGTRDHSAEMSSVLRTREGDTIYDYCWYNKMTNQDLDSRCFVSSCRESPVHMWDTVTGKLKCSYRAYDHLDEIAAAYSLAFSLDGTKLYAGYNKMIRVFHTERPGRAHENRPTFTGKVGGQPGIISCLAASPQGGGLYAAGSYSRGIALYYEPAGEMVCVFEGQQGGVTHIAFSPDGTKLYSGGRKDPEVLCWDLRKPGQILFVALRHVETNQRIYFDQDPTGQYLFSANHNGHIYVWDTKVAPIQRSPDTDFMLEPVSVFKAHNDAVNGVSIHPDLSLVATSSGQRHSPRVGDSDSDSECADDDDLDCIENSLKVWSFKES